VPEAAKSLGIASNILYRWKQHIEEQQQGKVLSEDEREELKRLRKENKNLRMEKEILKNCLHRFPLAHLNRNTISSYTVHSWKVVERLLEILIPSKNLTQGVSGPSVGGIVTPYRKVI
jgi:transposase-like protein